MSASTEALSLPDLGVRLTRWLTVAIDREQANAAAVDEAGAHRLPLEARLRIATFFSLACGVLFLPVEGSHLTRPRLASLLLLYGAHAALTTFVLIASFTGAKSATLVARIFVNVGEAALAFVVK